MRIEPYIGNPVIANQQDYNDLSEQLHEIDPNCQLVQLRPERLIIVNVARRTFPYPRKPTIEWVAGRLRYMAENGL